MAKVIGIGGVFFKAQKPKELAAWYREHLGLDVDPSYGGTAFGPADMPPGGHSVWCPFSADTGYFDPSDQSYMINLVVDDLDGALKQVAAGGATLVGDPEHFDYGDFGWFLDPEGNKVELWQPKDSD